MEHLFNYYQISNYTSSKIPILNTEHTRKIQSIPQTTSTVSLSILSKDSGISFCVGANDQCKTTKIYDYFTKSCVNYAHYTLLFSARIYTKEKTRQALFSGTLVELCESSPGISQGEEWNLRQSSNKQLKSLIIVLPSRLRGFGMHL